MVPHHLQGLRPIRRVRRYQRAELAAAIGVTPASYTRFERGERRIYWDKVVILADKLKVRTDDFIHMLSEEDAARLCDQRDKAAIAAGTFEQITWAHARVPAPPAAAVPPPPTDSVPPPPVSALTPASVEGVGPATQSSFGPLDPDAEVDAILDGWDVEG